jgi:hypothetical protein
MKKVYMFFLCAVVLINCGYSQWIDPYNFKFCWKVDNLKGKVKSFTEFGYSFEMLSGVIQATGSNGEVTFNYDSLGNRIKFITYDSSHNWFSINTYKYNEDGNQIEQIWEIRDGQRTVIVDLYEIRNNIVKRTNYSTSVGKTLVSSFIYKYDTNGKIIEKTEYINGDLSLKYNYKYNSKGNLVEKLTFLNNGVLETKEFYKYDLNGHPIETIQYFNGKLRLRVNYKYDTKGNIIEEIDYIKTNGISRMQKTLNKYDKNGNKIEIITSGDTNHPLTDANEKFRLIEKYEYDERGNWIKKTHLYNGRGYCKERRYEFY